MLAIALGVVVGCGGQSERASADSDSDAGSGGTVATGGTGGVAGTTDAGGAVTGGIGGTATGGSGTAATGGTSGAGGGRPCVYGGQTYDDGTAFPAADGCNTCTCSNGSIGCTLIDCPPQGDCTSLSEAYQDALAQAKTCLPNAEFECQRLVTSALQCGCRTHANDPSAITQLGQISLAWNDNACGTDIVCGACPPDPIGVICSNDGLCVDVHAE